MPAASRHAKPKSPASRIGALAAAAAVLIAAVAAFVFLPGGPASAGPDQHVTSAAGAVPGAVFANGDAASMHSASAALETRRAQQAAAAARHRAAAAAARRAAA